MIWAFFDHHKVVLQTHDTPSLTSPPQLLHVQRMTLKTFLM